MTTVSSIENVFLKYPEFIESDVRKNRSGHFYGYNINAGVMFDKHRIILPPELVKGKSVLDLGCCVAAAGAWVLEHGASRYVGVELQPSFVSCARQNLTKYFANSNWSIVESTFNDFFKQNVEKFDIIIACGVIYTTALYQLLIDSMTKIGDVIIIESNDPLLFSSNELSNVHNIENLPITQYVMDHSMVHEDGASLRVVGARPSTAALGLIFKEYGFTSDINATSQLGEIYNRLYSQKRRFIMTFTRATSQINSGSFEFRFKNPEGQVKDSWAANRITDVEYFKNRVTKIQAQVDNNAPSVKWEFNELVAKNFVDHATQHIPNYELVIDASVSVASLLLDRGMRIIDVGSASGRTLQRLWYAGFQNLVGVDSSLPMVEQSQSLLAHTKINIVHSELFPGELGRFNAVTCNWTLHFIKEKKQYLQSIFDNLESGGFVILSDKTKNDGVELELYHNFKRKQGVSEEEIAAKAASLVGVMFINDVEWYFNTLREVGFRDVSIINAAPCFTTFLAFK